MVVSDAIQPEMRFNSLSLYIPLILHIHKYLYVYVYVYTRDSTVGMCNNGKCF